MRKLEMMQRLANREAARLDVTFPVRVRWAGYENGRRALGRSTIAHAHASKGDPEHGMICIRRGLSTGEWRHTIKHEVAHFAPGSHRHGPGFLKARAKQGDRYAKAALRKAGLMRC